MKLPYMPLWVADYKVDTAHLDNGEHGAYLLLIMHYWITGALPHNDAHLARIACCTPETWARIRPTIAAFFDEGWRHGRADQEKAIAIEKYNKLANAGRQGGLAKAAAHSSDAKAMLKQRHGKRGSKRVAGTAQVVSSEPQALKDNENKSSDAIASLYQSPSPSPSPSSKDIDGVGSKVAKGPPRHGAVSKDRLFVYFKKGTAEFEAYSQEFKEATGDEPHATNDGRWFKYMGESAFFARQKK